MGEESKTLARSWLAKAKRDMAVAKILIEGSEPHRDAGVYHCQQAAEKSLKALLTLDEKLFPKSHDLRNLLDLAVPLHPELFSHANACILLTPYATEFRYPGDPLEPDPSEASEALLLAQNIVNAVTPLIPAEIDSNR